MLKRLARALVALAALSACPSAIAAPLPVPHVFGGTTLGAATDAPWAVLIDLPLADGGERCSGAIIDPTHVLTAAHCVVDGRTLRRRPINVIAGLTTLRTGSPREQVRTVTTVRIHPAFTDRGDVDLAQLAVAPAFDVTGPDVRSIPLVGEGGGLPDGAPVRLIGWGASSDGAPVTEEHELDQVLLRRATCASSIASMLCGWSGDGAACAGDSGGSLVTTAPTPVLVGIERLAFDPAGCAAGATTGYADLSTPQIARWLSGAVSVPKAPRGGGYAVLKGAGAVGAPLTCQSPIWTFATQVRFSFIDASTWNVLATSARGTYIVTRDDVGRWMSCIAIASSPGGITEAAASGQIEGHRSSTAVDPQLSLSIAATGEVAIEDVMPSGAPMRIAVLNGAGRTVSTTSVRDDATYALPRLAAGHYRVCATYSGSRLFAPARICRSWNAFGRAQDLVTVRSRKLNARHWIIRLNIAPALVGKRLTTRWRVMRCKAGACTTVRVVRRRATLRATTSLRSPRRGTTQSMSLVMLLPQVVVGDVRYLAGSFSVRLR